MTRSCPLDPGPGTLDGQARFFVSNRIRVGSAPSALSISLAPPSPRAVRTISMCSVPGSPIPNRWADLRAALAVGENGSCPSGARTRADAKPRSNHLTDGLNGQPEIRPDSVNDVILI